MKSRTLTTIGLPIRLDVLIKSHLKLVNARTVDRWSFSEDARSDVAICDPESPLSALTVKRSRQSGSTLCISLVDSNHRPLEGTIPLHDPLHVGDLIELLDRISRGVGIAPEPMSENDLAAPVQSRGSHAGQLARKLHELMNAGSRDLHLVEVGSLRFCLLPVSRSAFLHEPLGDSWLERMLDVDSEVTASAIPIARQQQVLSSFHHRASLIKLLWHAGLHCRNLAINPMVADGTPISLSRWPDFGILKYEPAHLRMSAELSRTQLSIDQLARVARTSIDQARAFVNACALCNLLDTEASAKSPPISVPAENGTLRNSDSVMVAPRRSLGFLNSIRAALGLRAA